MAAIGRRVTDRADRNRLDFPECARVVDLLQEKFGKVKVIWASENEKEIGKRETWLPS